MRVSVNLSWRYFLFLFALGGLIISAILAVGYYERMNEFVIASQTRIVAGTPSYDQWQKIPIPVYLRIRFFNITNPEGVAVGEKARVNEMGPYVYKETLEKFDVTFDKAADTVRYRQVRFYYFQPQLSDGRESDRITMMNIPFVAAAKIINDYTDAKFILATFENMLVGRGERLTSTHAVREILFDGFSVENILELANSDIVKQAHRIKILKPITKFKVPSRLANGKMGFLEGRNGSDEGWFVVRTGVQDSADFGRLVSWNNQTMLTTWRGPECNTPRGTDGIIYQPFLTPETRLEAFVPDVCRSLLFTKHETVQHGAVTTYRFRQPEEMYETVQENPDNYCYCPYKQAERCPPKGVLSIDGCFEGAPIVMSQPHFLGADPSVFEGVEGLDPDPDKHWGYLDLHPKTGLSVEVRQKVQFAIEVKRWPTMPTFSKVRTAFVPILWLEEGGDLEGLNLYLLVALDAGSQFWEVGKWGVVAAFGGLTLASLWLIKRQGQPKKQKLKQKQALESPAKPVKEKEMLDKEHSPPPRLSKAPPQPQPQLGGGKARQQMQQQRRRQPSPQPSVLSASTMSFESEYEKY